MTKTKNFTNQSKESEQELEVYRPPQDQQQDIVDVVCSIMDDDGPRPMKDLRPAQKHRNAVDQFQSDHHGTYEARGRASRDRIEAVHLHNSGYPKLHDELKKRRSTAKVTAIPAQRNTTTQQTNYNRCNTCMRNKKKVEPKKKCVPPRYRSHDANAKTGYRDNSRITKPKPRRPSKRSSCKIYRLSKIRTNRGIQCSTFYHAKDKKSGTDKIPYSIDEKMAVEEDSCQCSNQIFSDNFKQHDCNKSQCSKEDSSNRNHPDSEPSVSSYNSYASLEHEPMVSK